MLKKLVLAAAAVAIGMFVVKSTSVGSLAQVWWKDARAAVERQVPPEVQLRQLSNEIDKIDRDVKKNISKLAESETEAQLLGDNVASLQVAVRPMKEDLASMTKSLDAKAERVVFNGTSYRTSDLVRKLDGALDTYEAKKVELKSKERLLDIKKQAIDAARSRITEMRDQKEHLRVAVAQLDARLQLARLNATRNHSVEFDDSQVARCKELAESISKRLMIDEKNASLQAEFGYAKEIPGTERETKPTAEILKAARAALKDENEAAVAAKNADGN
jgi:predicted  nucleic acid-binding Zn-ribbon protein